MNPYRVRIRRFSIKEAMNAIEREPLVHSVPVHPMKPSKAIIGADTEGALPGEGTVLFDIVFFVRTKDKKRTTIILNPEVQKDFYPGYNLIPRGIIYGTN